MQGSDQLWLRELAKVEDFVEGELAWAAGARLGGQQAE